MPYSYTHRVLVALDCIIFGFDGGGLNLLLVKRNFASFRYLKYAGDDPMYK